MKYLVFLAALLLTGCASLPGPVAVADRDASWQQRQSQLAGMQSWRLRGRLSITSEDESWFLKVDWRQQKQRVFNVLLSGPFSSMLQLSGTEKNVELNDGEQRYQAYDAESLLFEHTGIRMPVNGLQYWVLGLPQPGIKVKALTLDKAGRLALLEQDEWQVEIDRYQKHNGKVLPARLVIKNHQLKVRLIIDLWLLQSSSV